VNGSVGRMVAVVGLVLGFVAIFVNFASVNGNTVKYSDDGTVLAFLLVALIAAAVLLAATMGGRDDLEAAAAVAGGAAFGFYLFVPSAFGFNNFGVVDTGGWLGVCSGLIPLGLWYSMSSRPATMSRLNPALAVPIVVGRICCLVAIWLTVELGASYWDLDDQGRALPALMLLLVIGGAVLGIATTFGSAPTRMMADGTLVLAAVTFGLYGAEVIQAAFGDFGSLDTGAWLGAVGGLILLLAVANAWSQAMGTAPAHRSQPAAAPPAV
jgi:hypothetical protein